MRNKLLVFILALFSLSAAFALAACGGGGPKVTPFKAEYDIGAGGDLEFTVDLNGGKLTRVKDDGAVVDPTEYLFEEKENKLTIFESYLLYAETKEHTFTLVTDKGETEFIVNITNKVKTSFDESDRGYAYGSGKDLEIDADFSTATVSSVTAGGRKLASADYSYDGAAKKFAVKTAFLDTLYGETEITVNLSNNQSYKFKVTSDCLFAANFDDDNIPSFYNEYRNATTTAAGWNGTRALHWKGNGGNLMIFYVENYNYGLQTAFEAGKTYCLSFQFKNNWTGEGNPEGFVGMSLSNTALFNLNYLNNTVDGGVASCDANGVWSVKIYFDAPAAGQFTYMYTGYRDGSDAVLFDLLFDNIVLLEAEDRPPVLDERDGEKTFSKGQESDLWFDGEFGLSKVKSVSAGGKTLSAEDYSVLASSVILKNSYLSKLTEDTQFIVTFENDKTVAFKVKLGKSLSTVFDEDNEREYLYGSGDLSFDVNFRGFPVLSVKNGQELVPESAYVLAENKLTVKQAYLDTLQGKNDFVLTVDNAGLVDGKDEAETHAFSITSNAAVNIGFGESDILSSGIVGAIAPEKNEIADGWDGKAWNLAATGGNFMAMKAADAAWSYGSYEAPFVDNTLYCLQFDVKLDSQTKLAGEASFVNFILHGTSVLASFHFDENKAFVPEANKGVTFVDRGNGVYTVSFRFTYMLEGLSGEEGCVRIEAQQYNEYSYDILFDNVVVYAVPLATSALYEHGSMRDVSYNVTFEEVKEVKANGVALAAGQYALEDGKLIIRGAFAETIVGSAEIVATKSDDAEETFILLSTLLQDIDFERETDPGFMAADILTSTQNGAVENGIEGKSWQLTATGGNFMTFAPAASQWLSVNMWPATITEFRAGVRYALQFDVKLLGQYAHGTKDAPAAAVNFILHGTDHDGKFYFDVTTGALTVTEDVGVTVTGGENGVYTVKFEFVYTPSGHEGCVRLEADSWQNVDYDILFDNISVNQIV